MIRVYQPHTRHHGDAPTRNIGFNTDTGIITGIDDPPWRIKQDIVCRRLDPLDPHVAGLFGQCYVAVCDNIDVARAVDFRDTQDIDGHVRRI